MKKYGLLTICLLLSSLFLQSCTVDNIDPTAQNVITQNGEKFDVTVVTLLGISIEGDGHAVLSFTGTNGALTKVLTVDVEYDPSQPVSGNYASPAVSGTRVMNSILTNYSEMPLVGAMYATILEKGSVTLKDNGESNYTITLDLEMKDGKKFKGTYQGDVQETYQNQ